MKFDLVPETLESPFRDDFPGYTDGMVRGEPGRFFVAPPFGEHGEDIYNFPMKSDDVWIVTFPKCGKLNLKSVTLTGNTSAFYYLIEQISLQGRLGSKKYFGCLSTIVTLKELSRKWYPGHRSWSKSVFDT